jgi:hypothetical protein
VLEYCAKSELRPRSGFGMLERQALALQARPLHVMDTNRCWKIRVPWLSGAAI